MTNEIGYLLSLICDHPAWRTDSSMGSSNK